MKLVQRLFYRHSPYDGFPAERFPPDANFDWTSAHPLLEDAVRWLRPDLILEIGSWTGGSAIRIGRACADAGLASEIVCIDTWLGSPEMVTVLSTTENYNALGYRWGYPTLYYTFLRNVIDAGLQRFVTPLPLPSESAAFVLADLGITAPLIYVDGGHQYETVRRDLECYWPLLRDGGVLIGDDFGNPAYPGVERAAREFATAVGEPLWTADCWFALAKLDRAAGESAAAALGLRPVGDPTPAGFPLLPPVLLDAGPKRVVAGEPFNVQPNGFSAVWARAEGLSSDARLVLAGAPLRTTRAAPGLLTAWVLPHQVPPPGRHDLFVRDRGGDSAPISFLVRSATEAARAP